MTTGGTGAAVVGPNTILQLALALEAQGGRALARQVFEAAELGALLDAPPGAMVPERQAAAVMRAVHASLPPATAARVSHEAGRRTGDYILRHRIPLPARVVLRLLPARLAARLLLRAILAHAWTFAGSGRVELRAGEPARLMIHDNPLSVAGSGWHRAVLETLFRGLVDPRAQVVQTACCATGAGACIFEIVPRPRARGARVAGPHPSA
ncbi:divinyl protochlorophyllide a 8-vinyl-reductase [Roseovarius sp. MBR-78]|jgi:divinyl protochlorophyllide a 8-vinyl-reductase|uniref:bacteriochlorophyll 4-vinyl reductase n=1 Tax=Roseovarius sp. MBR-78 TaxID=3156460 RepID=UPI003394A551